MFLINISKALTGSDSLWLSGAGEVMNISLVVSPYLLSTWAVVKSHLGIKIPSFFLFFATGPELLTYAATASCCYSNYA